MDPIIPGLPGDVARECLGRIPYNEFYTVASVSKLWQSEIESPAFLRLRNARGLSQPVIVLSQAEPSSDPSATSSYRLTLYEPDSATWSALPVLPGLAHGLPHFSQLAVAGRFLVVIGGWCPKTWAASDDVFVYDFVLATWRRGARLPGGKRSFFACASDSRRMVYVAGGHDGNNCALRSALAYDVVEDRWVPLPDMDEGRDECTGVIRGRVFHVTAGYVTGMLGQSRNNHVAFDLDTWRWGHVEGVAPAAPRRADDQGDVYRGRSGHVDVLDGDRWRTVADLPDAVRVVSFVVPCGGKKLMVLGSPYHEGPRVGYILEVGGGLENNRRWTKVEVPEEYSGNIQAGLCLVI